MFVKAVTTLTAEAVIAADNKFLSCLCHLLSINEVEVCLQRLSLSFLKSVHTSWHGGSV